jgi:hypothetical protein
MWLSRVYLLARSCSMRFGTKNEAQETIATSEMVRRLVLKAAEMHYFRAEQMRKPVNFRAELTRFECPVEWSVKAVYPKSRVNSASPTPLTCPH